MQSRTRTCIISVTATVLFLAALLLTWQQTTSVPSGRPHATGSKVRQQGAKENVGDHVRLLPRQTPLSTQQSGEVGTSGWEQAEHDPREQQSSSNRVMNPYAKEYSPLSEQDPQSSRKSAAEQVQSSIKSAVEQIQSGSKSAVEQVQSSSDLPMDTDVDDSIAAEQQRSENPSSKQDPAGSLAELHPLRSETRFPLMVTGPNMVIKYPREKHLSTDPHVKLKRYNGVWIFQSNSKTVLQNRRVPRIGVLDRRLGRARLNNDYTVRVLIANLINAWLNGMEKTQDVMARRKRMSQHWRPQQILDIGMQWFEGYPPDSKSPSDSSLPLATWSGWNEGLSSLLSEYTAFSVPKPVEKSERATPNPADDPRSIAQALGRIPTDTVVYIEWEPIGQWLPHEFYNQGDFTDSLQGDVWTRIVGEGEIAGEYTYRPMPRSRPKVKGAMYQDKAENTKATVRWIVADLETLKKLGKLKVKETG